MSEVLDSLNAPESGKSWAAEVAEVAAQETAPSVTEAAAPEPAQEPEKTDEPAAEPAQPQETASDEPDRRVPLKALQEERQKRAQYEQMLAQREQELRQYQEWAAQMQQQQVPQQEAPAEPDPETDPIGALKYARDQLRQMQQMTAEQQYVSQLNQVAYSAANQFKAQVPDYSDAYQYALQSRAQELMALGAHQQDIPTILHREELSLIDSAVRNGRNPAEAIYQFAKARGFQGKAAEVAQATRMQPTAAASTPSAPDPVMQETKRAVAASASAAGAPASKGQISLADMANLKGAAFDSAWNKYFGGNGSSIFRE